MNKSIFVFALLCSCILLMVGCNGKEIKEIDGKVVNIQIHRDTLRCAKLVVDTDTLLFKMDDARFINGMFIIGDSVTINYIDGQDDTLRALVVNIIPKSLQHFGSEDEKSDTLLTAPIKK